MKLLLATILSVFFMVVVGSIAGIAVWGLFKAFRLGDDC